MITKLYNNTKRNLTAISAILMAAALVVSGTFVSTTTTKTAFAVNAQDSEKLRWYLTDQVQTLLSMEFVLGSEIR
jgi:hypothetical protein